MAGGDSLETKKKASDMNMIKKYHKAFLRETVRTQLVGQMKKGEKRDKKTIDKELQVFYIKKKQGLQLEEHNDLSFALLCKKIRFSYWTLCVISYLTVVLCYV